MNREQLTERVKEIMVENRGYDIHSLKMSQLYYAKYHESVDWHRFSSILEHLAGSGFLMPSGYSFERRRLYRYVGEY